MKKVEFILTVTNGYMYFLVSYIPLHDLCNFLFIYIPFLDFVGRLHLRFNAYVLFSLAGQLGPYPDSAVSSGPYKLGTQKTGTD